MSTSAFHDPHRPPPLPAIKTTLPQARRTVRVLMFTLTETTITGVVCSINCRLHHASPLALTDTIVGMNTICTMYIGDDPCALAKDMTKKYHTSFVDKAVVRIAFTGRPAKPTNPFLDILVKELHNTTMEIVNFSARRRAEYKMAAVLYITQQVSKRPITTHLFIDSTHPTIVYGVNMDTYTTTHLDIDTWTDRLMESGCTSDPFSIGVDLATYTNINTLCRCGGPNECVLATGTFLFTADTLGLNGNQLYTRAQLNQAITSFIKEPASHDLGALYAAYLAKAHDPQRYKDLQSHLRATIYGIFHMKLLLAVLGPAQSVWFNSRWNIKGMALRPTWELGYFLNLI